MNNDPHFGFVIAAYGFGFFVLAGMVLLILRDYWSLKRALSQFAVRASREGLGDQGLADKGSE